MSARRPPRIFTRHEAEQRIRTDPALAPCIADLLDPLEGMTDKQRHEYLEWLCQTPAPELLLWLEERAKDFDERAGA